MDFSRTKLIACATVVEEVRALVPANLGIEVLDFGLHLVPGQLKGIILGYGLCSMAVVGLKSDSATLIIPRVDDCIALFLGSQAAYKSQIEQEPGTYYLSRGWVEAGDTLIDDYERMLEKYGQERADRMMELMLTNYRRLVFVDTGQPNRATYAQFARRTALQFGLRYEEIAGPDNLMRKMLMGPWDDDFVVVQPGQTVNYLHFRYTYIPVMPRTPP
jgi:hypothetical protein